jgi:hypothetical protein
MSSPVASTSALNEPDELVFPPLTRAAVDACAFKSWYPNFKRVTPKATILDLEDGFIEYLKADGLFLPDDDDDEESNDGCVRVETSWTSYKSANMLEPITFTLHCSSAPDPNGEDSDEEDADDDMQRPKYDFSKLSPRIQQVIDDYGAVFPKLNWSSPQVRFS